MRTNAIAASPRELLTGRDAVNVEWANSSDVQSCLPPTADCRFARAMRSPGTVGLAYEDRFAIRPRLDGSGRMGETTATGCVVFSDVQQCLGLVPATAQRRPCCRLDQTLRFRRHESGYRHSSKLTPTIKRRLPARVCPLPPLARVIRSRYESLLVPARAEVLRQLKLGGSDKEETPKRWEAVRVWLKEPTELASWRQLALPLLRMEDPLADDPATVLRTFLNRETFDLTFGFRSDRDSRFALLFHEPRLRSIFMPGVKAKAPR
jgi:hypothetical protein